MDTRLGASHMNRRGFMQAILAAGTAPYVCTAAGVLMPCRGVLVPRAPLVLRSYTVKVSVAGQVMVEFCWDGSVSRLPLHAGAPVPPFTVEERVVEEVTYHRDGID